MNNNDKTTYDRSSLVIYMILVLPLSFGYTFLTEAPFLGVLVGNFFVALAAYSLTKECHAMKNGYVIILIVIAKYALLIYQAINKDLPMGGEDWWNFHNNAQNAIQRNPNLFLMLFAEKPDLFSKCVGFLYALFGVHTMYINLYIFAGSLVAAKYVIKSAMLLTDGDYASSAKALLFFMLWPIDIIYSITYLREMPIQALVIVSFYNYIVFTEKRKPLNFLLAFLFIILANMMHSGVIALIVVYLIFAFKKKQDYNMKVLSLSTLVLLIVAIILLRFSPLWDLVASKLGNVETVDGLVKRSQQFVEGDASTRYVTEMPNNIGAFIIQVPWRAALFAVVPLPWMVNSFETAFAWVVDALPQIWIIYRIIKLNIMTKGTKQRIYYVICVLSMIGTYMVCGMGTTAYGNAIRHRAKIIPMILVFIIAVYNYLRKPKVEKQDESEY